MTQTTRERVLEAIKSLPAETSVADATPRDMQPSTENVSLAPPTASSNFQNLGASFPSSSEPMFAR